MKAYIKTFGCQMNEYDSEKILDIVYNKLGYVKTDNVNDAALILFNTCSIREKAQEKFFSELGRIKLLKIKNRNIIIGVGGCVASQEGKNIFKRAPYVDIVFGPQTIHLIPKLIQNRIDTGLIQIDTSFTEIDKFDNLPVTSEINGVTAFVSIMEGCSKYCSYCIVPYTRGQEISRPFEDVLNEINLLAEKGIQEINLLGQNVNAYKYTINNKTADLASLLKQIQNIDKVKRIRFTTSHPNEMTDRIINCYSTLDKLMPYLHLPVQSGSDKILSLMKRGYTALEYKSIIRKIRNITPNISISSDFIVGFPNETEEEFSKTLNLIDEIRFDTSFSFIFSPRPGTPAANIIDVVPYEEKLNRLQRLQAKLLHYAENISKSMIGTIQNVLVENQCNKNNLELIGRTENFKLVNFLGHKQLINRLVKVKITQGLSRGLYGELV